MKLGKPGKALELGWKVVEIHELEYENLGTPDQYDTVETLRVDFTSPEVQEKTKKGVESVFFNIKERTDNDGNTYYTGSQDIANLIEATETMDLDDEPELSSTEDFVHLIGSRVAAYRFKKPNSKYTDLFKQRFLSTELVGDEKQAALSEANERFDEYFDYINRQNSGNTSNGSVFDGPLGSDDDLDEVEETADDGLGDFDNF